MCPTCLCVRRFSQSSDEPRHRFPPDARPRSSVRSCPTLRGRCFPAAPSPVRAAHEPPGASVCVFIPRRRTSGQQTAAGSGSRSLQTLQAEPAARRLWPFPEKVAASAPTHESTRRPFSLIGRCPFRPSCLLSPAPATSSVRLFLVTQTLLICPCLKNSTARTRPTRHPRARGHPWPPCCQSPWPSPRLAAPASSVCTPPPPRGTVLRGDTLPAVLTLWPRTLPSRAGSSRLPSLHVVACLLLREHPVGGAQPIPFMNMGSWDPPGCPRVATPARFQPGARPGSQTLASTGLRPGCRQAPPLIKAFTPLDAPWIT